MIKRVIGLMLLFACPPADAQEVPVAKPGQWAEYETQRTVITDADCRCLGVGLQDDNSSSWTSYSWVAEVREDHVILSSQPLSADGAHSSARPERTQVEVRPEPKPGDVVGEEVLSVAGKELECRKVTSTLPGPGPTPHWSPRKLIVWYSDAVPLGPVRSEFRCEHDRVIQQRRLLAWGERGGAAKPIRLEELGDDTLLVLRWCQAPFPGYEWEVMLDTAGNLTSSRRVPNWAHQSARSATLRPAELKQAKALLADLAGQEPSDHAPGPIELLVAIKTPRGVLNLGGCEASELRELFALLSAAERREHEDTRLPD